MIFYETIFQDLCIRGFIHEANSREIVLVFHGFTGNKFDHHGIIKRIANTISYCGMNAYRFDFLGSGDSDGDFLDYMSIKKEEIQALYLVNHFRNMGFKVHVFGYSLGGIIATKVARIVEVESLFLLSPAGNFQDILLKMLDEENNVNGFRIPDRFIEEVKNTCFFENGYKGRVKIVQGSADQYVTRDSLKKFEELYPQAEIFIISDADHCFSKERDTLEVEKEVIKFYGKS